MDFVLPEYYEWHGEFEKVCKNADLRVGPDMAKRLYRVAGAFVALSILADENKKEKKANEKAIQIFSRFDNGNIAAAITAYFKALANSHDRKTAHAGENLINICLYHWFKHIAAN